MPKNDIKSELEEEPEIILSNSPTSSTDFIYLAQADNGSILMQLISAIPKHFIENHRTILSAEFIEPLIDMLCDISNYYPKKPKKKSGKKKQNSKV